MNRFVLAASLLVDSFSLRTPPVPIRSLDRGDGAPDGTNAAPFLLRRPTDDRDEVSFFDVGAFATATLPPLLAVPLIELLLPSTPGCTMKRPFEDMVRSPLAPPWLAEHLVDAGGILRSSFGNRATTTAAKSKSGGKKREE